jgi:hypothetical protein
LGKVENYITRHGKRLATEGRVGDALEGIMSYRNTDWTHNPLHPTHLTEDDKLARKYRRLIKRCKKNETKQKYRDLLKELLS